MDDAAVFGASPVATFASQRPTAEHEAVATPSDAAEPDARSAPVVQDDARINIATEARDEKPSGPAEEVEMEKLSGDSNVPFGSSLPGTKAVAAIFGASPVAIANERQTTELEVGSSGSPNRFNSESYTCSSPWRCSCIPSVVIPAS